MRYVIEKDGERQNVTSLSGYDGWAVVSEVGDEIPDHEAELLEGQWVVPIAVLRERKWAEIKAIRDELRYSGCDTPKGRMDNDPDSQRKLTSAVTMAGLLGDTFSVGWTMEDNSVVTHDKAEMEAAGLAVGMFDAQCHAIGQALRAQIETATAEELDAIRWPAVS